MGKDRRMPMPTSETLQQLQALISGASPDETKALRRALFKRDAPEQAGTDPTPSSAPAGARVPTPTSTYAAQGI